MSVPSPYSFAAGSERGLDEREKGRGVKHAAMPATPLS
jgi:hypothetical protein